MIAYQKGSPAASFGTVDEDVIDERVEGPKDVKVLIVDDNIDNIHLFESYLKGSGAFVLSAKNGVEAVQQASAIEFDLILMDIQMPQMDGWQTARTLRQNGYAGKLIACSAFGLSDDQYWFGNSDFDGYLKKPIYRDELLRYMKSLESSRENVRETAIDSKLTLSPEKFLATDRSGSEVKLKTDGW